MPVWKPKNRELEIWLSDRGEEPNSPVDRGQAGQPSLFILIFTPPPKRRCFHRNVIEENIVAELTVKGLRRLAELQYRGQYGRKRLLFPRRKTLSFAGGQPCAASRPELRVTSRRVCIIVG